MGCFGFKGWPRLAEQELGRGCSNQSLVDVKKEICRPNAAREWAGKVVTRCAGERMKLRRSWRLGEKATQKRQQQRSRFAEIPSRDQGKPPRGNVCGFRERRENRKLYQKGEDRLAEGENGNAEREDVG